MSVRIRFLASVLKAVKTPPTEMPFTRGTPRKMTLARREAPTFRRDTKRA